MKTPLPKEYPCYRYHQIDPRRKPLIVRNEQEDARLNSEEWGEYPWSEPLPQEALEPSILPMARPGVLQPGEVSDVTQPSGAPRNADPGLSSNIQQVLPPPPGPKQAAPGKPIALAVPKARGAR